MNFQLPIEPDDVDKLVGAYLDAEARGVDVPRNVAAIERRLQNAGSAAPERIRPTASGRRFLIVARRFAIAAAVFLAVGLFGYFAVSPESVEADAVVREAHEVLNKKVDRCYRVGAEVPKVWLNRNPMLSVGDESIVWSRGDRFRVETTLGNLKYVWGQDAGNTMWVVDAQGNGLRFKGKEIPQMLQRTRAILALDMVRLVKVFLDSCDLEVEDERTTDVGQVVTIRATYRQPGTGVPFLSARLEVEMKTKLIRRMELDRVVSGGEGSIVFTLIDMAHLPDNAYWVETYVGPGGEVLGNDRASERKENFEALLIQRRKEGGL